MNSCRRCQRFAPQGAWFCPACGEALPSPDPSLIEGRYRLEEELGRSAVGIVFAARDAELDRRVAVKVINPRLTRSPAVVAHLRAEARALATVRSENVVRVHAFGTHGGRSFFAMELVEGRSLACIIDDHDARGRHVPVSRALALLEQVAEGLDAVHAARLVHRDVKPANILVEDGTDRPVLVDFGLALSALSTSGEILPAGTPSYMAPEQIAGARIGPSTDVYAFACSAFELLTGEVPFPGTDIDEVLRCHLLVDAPPPSRWRAELEPLDDAFARALAKDASLRQPTCSQLVGEIVTALGTRLRVVTPPEEAHASPERDGALIVVVEADAPFARTIARAAALSLFGSTPSIVVAATAEEARLRIGPDAPDIVVLGGDILKGGGEAFVDHVRRMPGGDAVNFIAVRDGHGGSGLRFGPATPSIERSADFPALLRDVHAAIASCGVRTAAPPERARNGPPRVPRRRRTG